MITFPPDIMKSIYLAFGVFHYRYILIEYKSNSF